MRLSPRIYDLVMAPWEHGPLGHYRHAVVSGARGRVLEIGAGTGLNFRHYERATVVVATDPDAAMLARAKTRASALTADILLVVADAEALPVRNASFDHAVVGLAMCTIPHPDRALAELHRTVRPGGSVRMLEHVRVDKPAFVGRIQDWLTPVWRRVASGCHLNRRTVEAVQAAGFKPLETTSHAGGYLREIYASVPLGHEL